MTNFQTSYNNGIHWIRMFTLKDSSGNICQTPRLPILDDDDIAEKKKQIIDYKVGAPLLDKAAPLRSRCFLMLTNESWKVAFQESTHSKELIFELDEFLDLLTIKKLECVD